MAAASFHGEGLEPEGIVRPQTRDEGQLENLPPWELIDIGRYRPRRIRGSLRGRELG
jgi:hypothetical protein